MTIAALRIAFDFTFFFQQAANQFRHFFVTFGLDAMAEKRRFMIRVALGLTLAMALTAFTPLGPLLIAEGIGAEAEVTRRALAALQVMTLLPLLIILRNLFHGILMVEERTGGMALGSILRVLTIAGLAQLLAPVGLLLPAPPPGPSSPALRRKRLSWPTGYFASEPSRPSTGLGTLRGLGRGQHNTVRHACGTRFAPSPGTRRTRMLA